MSGNELRPLGSSQSFVSLGYPGSGTEVSVWDAIANPPGVSGESDHATIRFTGEGFGSDFEVALGVDPDHPERGFAFAKLRDLDLGKQIGGLDVYAKSGPGTTPGSFALNSPTQKLTVSDHAWSPLAHGPSLELSRSDLPRVPAYSNGDTFHLHTTLKINNGNHVITFSSESSEEGGPIPAKVCEGIADQGYFGGVRDEKCVYFGNKVIVDDFKHREHPPGSATVVDMPKSPATAAPEKPAAGMLNRIMYALVSVLPWNER